MKKKTSTAADKTKKGYNEKNPTQPEGAFPSSSIAHKPAKRAVKSNAADKNNKEKQN